jgi:two-component system, cell cycle sensor histidine kinase and response regulator CckA
MNREFITEENDAFYRVIFENTGTAILLLEEDTTISLVNSEFEKLSGYTKHEIERKLSWTDFVHEDDLPKMLENHKKRREHPQSVPRNYEFRFIDRSGDVKYISLTIEMIPETKRSIASLINITENKQIHKAMEYRLRFEKKITQISRDFINLPKHKIDNGIERALETIGEFAQVDRSYIFLLSDDGEYFSNTHEWCARGVESVKALLQDRKATDAAWTVDRLKQNKDINLPSLDLIPDEAAFEREELSSQGIKAVAIVPLFYEGTLRGFLGFDSTRSEKTWLEEDISLLRTAGDIFINALEKKSYEEKLRISEQKYRDFVNFLPQVVFESDLAGRLIFVNHYAFDKFGYTREEFEHGLTIFQMLDEKDWSQARENLEKLYQGESTVGAEYTGVTKQGDRFPILIYSTPVFNEGKLISLRGIIIDISLRKELEEQLKQSQKLEAIGRLAGGIAHDFNNILTSILGHCHLLLLNEKLCKECELEIQNIMTTSKSGASLTRQLLAFSRKQITDPKSVNINSIIRSSQSMLDRLINENIIITPILEDALDLIKADPGQIEQIIMNLVINSSDAMPEGGRITIKTQNASITFPKPIQGDKVEPGDYVLLAVTDEGHGMDKETKEQAIDPFFTTKDLGRGTGLGLSTVYGIVKQSGGYLEIQSTPDIGTDITLYFPREKQQTGPKKKKTKTKAHSNGETLLVVEDEKTVRKVMTEILNAQGYTVLEAENGNRALSLIRSDNSIDMVITDVIMPGINGRELIDLIKKEKPDIRFLYVSGYTDNDVIRQGVETNRYDFLQKPFSSQQLSEKIREILTK